MPSTAVLTELFGEIFGSEPEVVCHAPGRVNLLGDHTDYNDGFVLPVAINHETSIAASKRDDNLIRVYACNHCEEITEISLDNLEFSQDAMWQNYLAGTLKSLHDKYSNISGANLVVNGNVPLGVGLSSSASYEVAILKTFSDLFDLNLHGIQAALLGQKAENDFVGCNCGIMDQLISAMGKEGHAMLLDCRDLSYNDAPIPDNLALIVINSNVKRELVDSEYNLRRRQCEEVANYFDIKALRDLSLDTLNAAKHKLDLVLYKRAKHVITENTRTKKARQALLNNDIEVLSSLMRESHISLRDDYEVTTYETDYLVAIIDEILGAQGGVRMTGGGFGGCVVALVPQDMVDSLARIVITKYSNTTKITPDIYVCKPSQGAFRERTMEEYVWA